MKFLVDECMSARLSGLMRSEGWDAVHVHDLNLGGSLDADLMDIARDEDRVLVTMDSDYGELLAKTGASGPSTIYFRQSDRSAERQATMLHHNLGAIAEDLRAGAMVVFTDDRIRIRALPID